MESVSAEDEDADGGGFDLELVKSYLAFARRAVADRALLAASILVTVVTLATVGAAFWPRSYGTELRLLVQRSQVLDMDERSMPLEAASDVVTRHEALVTLVRRLGLVTEWNTSRPGALRFKDSVMEAVRGKPTVDDLEGALVSMLENRLWARPEGNVLTIGIEWPNPEQAKRIVDAATDGFLDSRHHAEISVIEEKMGILEKAANDLRVDIETMAGQIGQLKETKRAAAQKAAREATQAAPSALTPTPMTRHAPTPDIAADAAKEEDLASLKEQLAAKKHELSDLQSRRSQALAEAKGKLADLKLRLTDDHPEVRAAEQRLNTLSLVPIEETALTVDVETLEAEAKRAGVARAAGPTGGFHGTSAASTAVGGADPLPSDILKLLETSNDIDPAVSVQLSTDLAKYTELRGTVRSARVNLDTAQAAFNFRYKIVVPAAVPSKPSKPNVLMVLMAGVGAALLLALLVPIILELKRGIIVARWQVQSVRLPILGELRFPGSSN